jgi:RHS repeat-associated protein
VHFGYDGQGRRVRKATATQTLRHIYSGGQLIAEVDTGSLSAQKIYRYYPGVDHPLSVKEPAGTYYYLSGIGTPGVVGLIDSTGHIKNRYRYSPWGALEDSLEGVPNVLKYAGREYDPETHLYYNRARYYDPQLARFLSEDPIGQNGGTNQYAYGANNPVGATDPSGNTCDYSGDPYDNYGANGSCSPEADGGLPGPAGGAPVTPDCSDRGPTSLLGGAPDVGYSPCQGDIFDDATGEDITADAAAQMQEYLRQQQMADIYNELVSGDPNALSDFLGPYSFAIVNFPGRCPKNADFNGEIVSTEFFADAVHVNVRWVIPPVPAPAPGLGWYKGRIYSLNSLNLPNGRVGMNVSGIVPCGPGLQVGEFNEDNVIIQGSD